MLFVLGIPKGHLFFQGSGTANLLKQTSWWVFFCKNMNNNFSEQLFYRTSFSIAFLAASLRTLQQICQH